jgi:hypothetical protein
MSPRTVRHPCHARGRVKSASADLRDVVGCPRPVNLSDSITHRGAWDSLIDDPAPKEAPLGRVGLGVLGVVARVGLALFVTTGFAAGLNLHTSLSPSDPQMIRVCEAVFFWSLALVSASMHDRGEMRGRIARRRDAESGSLHASGHRGDLVTVGRRGRILKTRDGTE